MNYKASSMQSGRRIELVKQPLSLRLAALAVTTKPPLTGVQEMIVECLFYPKAPTRDGRTTDSPVIRRNGKGATRSDYNRQSNYYKTIKR